MITAPSTHSAAGSPFHSFRVGTALVWIDIKQGLRKHMAGNSWRARLLQSGGALFGLLFLAGLHLAAFSLVIYAGAGARDHIADLYRGLSTAIWSFLLFVMLSGGLVRALVVLHEQDDSNLLLSSPVSPRAVLAAKLFGNALQSCVVDGFIIVPWINILVFAPFGHWKYLWGYPVWLALAMVVTCIDGLFSFGLIRWFGLRRARFYSQVVPFALIFGITLLTGSLSVSMTQMGLDAGQSHMPLAMQTRFIEMGHTPLAWMARAAAGSPLHLVLIFSTAAALSMVTLRLTERTFVEGTQHLVENSVAAIPGKADGLFRSGVLKLEVRKNLRLISRTPMIVLQCIAQIMTPIVVAVVMGRDNLAMAVAFFMIFSVGVLAGMFTIAAGAVEECDDLLRMSPHGERWFRLGKMLSGCLWPLMGALVVGIGLALTREELLAGAVLLGGIPLGLASSLVGETFATPVKPGTRPKLLSDPIMMIPLLGMQVTSGLVAGLTVFCAALSETFFLFSLLASYFVLIVAMGLAQLRKPLF